jgi:RimJ/RimL family protein N-acetyltransferase
MPPFEYGAVRLRLLREEDLPLTRGWRNQDYIRRWFFSSGVLSPEQHQNWFEQYCQRDDDFTFIIEEVQADYRPVGQVALYHVDWTARRAEFGRLMIGELDAAGKGYGLNATLAVLKIAFNILGFKEVYLEVLDFNEKAIVIYERAGFKNVSVIGNIKTMNIICDDYRPAARRCC